MPCRTPFHWWRGFLLAANAMLPIPTLAMLFTGTPGGVWLLVITLAMHGLLLWGIMAPRAKWLGPLIHRFPTTKKEVWLTIDDGPVGEATRELSAALRERGVQATFFVIGSRLRADPGAAAILQQDGHTLANHSGTHPRKSFWCSPGRIARREVEEGIRALEETGVTSPCFRPPVGHKPPALHRILHERGLHLIGWDAGGRDGWAADPSGTVRRVLANVTPGSVIVLHEGRAHSHATILAVVDALTASGYRFTVPRTELLHRAGCEEPGNVQCADGTNRSAAGNENSATGPEKLAPGPKNSVIGTEKSGVGPKNSGPALP